MAAWFGIGKDTVARIWQRHNLKPWTREAFKVSSDPQFDEKPVDVVLDNLSAHKAEPVARWLAHPKRARWHLHFTPTSSSWQNLVEGWLSAHQAPAEARYVHLRR
jgi:DDE superfamily endonuclease